MGVYEVTQQQYEKVMGENPSWFKGAANPVEGVPWADATEFCKRLSAKEGKTYRLPTEAEWEYACRAGTTTAYSFGDDESRLGEYAWFGGHSGGKTHPVGQKKPNAWGLYDMHGNVSEWCQDCYGDYPNSLAPYPGGLGPAFYRAIRGGGWNSRAWSCRSVRRNGQPPKERFNCVGFRVARSPSGR